MPEFVFEGPGLHDYPELRLSDGTWAGTVEPGGIRDLAEAPDSMWREATDEDREALAAREQAARQTPGAEAAGAGEPPAVPDEPAPRLPSRRKAAPGTDTAGVTGSEENQDA